MNMRIPFVILVVLLSLACLSATAQVGDSIIKVDEIVTAFKLKKKGALPFGFKPGASIADVKAALEKTEVFKEDSSYITYSVYFSEDKYDFGDITFDFADGRVTDVSIETYFGKKESAKKALNLLKFHFDKIYKPGEYADHILEWKYSKKGVNIWIQLTQVDYEGDNGFVLDFFTSKPGD